MRLALLLAALAALACAPPAAALACAAHEDGDTGARACALEAPPFAGADRTTIAGAGAEVPTAGGGRVALAADVAQMRGADLERTHAMARLEVDAADRTVVSFTEVGQEDTRSGSTRHDRDRAMTFVGLAREGAAPSVIAMGYDHHAVEADGERRCETDELVAGGTRVFLSTVTGCESAPSLVGLGVFVPAVPFPVLP